MKTLLGGVALTLVVAASAWSSDAVSGRDDAPARPGHHQPRSTSDKPDKPDKPGKTGDPARSDRGHPHGGPPGQTQRHRTGPPPWAGGPEVRTAEPPGLAKKGPRG